MHCAEHRVLAATHLPALLRRVLGLGPVPWLLMGEILPTTALAWAPSLATVSCYSFIALANWSFPFLEPRLGFYGVFWLFR